MTSGVFGGLLFCNLVFPSAITDEAKIVCSLVIGFGLWYLALHGERVVLQIFGVSAGMATGTFLFNIVAEFYIINAHFLILALAVVSNLVARSRGRVILFSPLLFSSLLLFFFDSEDAHRALHTVHPSVCVSLYATRRIAHRGSDRDNQPW